MRALVCRGIAENVGHRLFQFLDRDRETVDFLVAFHVQEGVVGDVAEVLDLGFDAPVPVVFLEQLVLVEEAAVEATHVVVALHASVHDSLVALLADTLLGDVLVGPVRVAPVFRADLAEFDGGGGVVEDGLAEGGVEVAVVEEDIGVVEPAVEVTLDGLERFDHAVQLLIPGQDHEGGVGSGCAVLDFGVETAVDEDLVVFLGDLPDARRGAGGDQPPSWTVRMSDEEEEDDNEDDDGEDQDQIQGYADLAVPA